MAKAKQTAEEIAAELYDIRTQKNELLKRDKELSLELKKRIKKGEDQNYYQIRTDYAIDIADDEAALRFALSEKLVKVDVPAVDNWIKNNRHAIPEGFALVEKEKLVEIKE